MGSTTTSMPPKKKKGGDEKPFLGRPKNNVKMGIVGLPNVGKSTTFNLMCGMSVAAENFPFCTIDPTESRVAYPDEKYDWLVDLYKPKSEVPAYLTVTDIAGLIRGASEGEGLGNAFLSNILACDAIFHLVRAFSDEDIIHVDGDVNPVRDLETIRNELLIKDMQFVNDNYSRCAAEAALRHDQRGFIFDRQACCFPCEHEREELRHQKEQASCRSADLDQRELPRRDDDPLQCLL